VLVGVLDPFVAHLLSGETAVQLVLQAPALVAAVLRGVQTIRVPTEHSDVHPVGLTELPWYSAVTDGVPHFSRHHQCRAWLAALPTTASFAGRGRCRLVAEVLATRTPTPAALLTGGTEQLAVKLLPD
jgi:hypothetical protein